MRASEIIREYGVGKITAQNATADVKPGDEFINVKKLQLETIRKIGPSKWRLYSKDGKKNLGTFDSLEAAKKHEREVQYFKHR